MTIMHDGKQESQMTKHSQNTYQMGVNINTTNILIVLLLLFLGLKNYTLALCVLVVWKFMLLLRHESKVVNPPNPSTLPYAFGIEHSQGSTISKPFAEYPKISEEVETIIGNTIRDFVTPWYQQISTNSAFTEELRMVLYELVRDMKNRLDNIDLADLLVLKLLPLITKHFNAFTLAYEIVSGDVIAGAVNEDSKSFSLAVAVEFTKNYKRHQALTGNLKLASSDIQKYLIEKSKLITANVLNGRELSSPFTKILSREILSNCVLHPFVLKLSSSDFWNIKLVEISKKVLKERTQVQELRKALSKEIEDPYISGPRSGTRANTPTKYSLSVASTGQEFEQFLKYLSGLSQQADLNSEKFFILAKLLTLSKNTYLSTAEYEFQKRLQLSLNLVESRLSYIVGANNSIAIEFNDTQLSGFESLVKSVDIQTVLADSEYTKYFHDFLVSCHGHKGCLEFWCFVEGVKNPLEDPTNETMAINLSDNGIMDLKTAYNNFLKDDKPLHSFSNEYIRDISYFVQTYAEVDKITRAKLYLRARKCLLLLQDECFKKLENVYFPRFKDSSLFLRMISSSEFTRSSLFADYVNNTAVSCNNNSGDTKLKKVGMMVIGDIDKALDNILNDDDPQEAGRNYVKNKRSHSTLFGNADHDGIFDDTLFVDDSMSQHCESHEDINNSEHSEHSDNDIPHELLRSDIVDGDIMDSKIELRDIKEEIAKLTISIDELQKQLELLKHLILKAELTNNQSQLKLLRKSERTLSNELEYKELLKQQYTVLENANSLFGKTKVSIKTYISELSAEDGKEVTYYIIRVNHLNGSQITSWEIPRRYSEFYKLNIYLKKSYGSLVSHLQKKHVFPQKVKMSLKYHVSKSLLYGERRMKLESYLRSLLLLSDVCQDTTFRRFLTDVSNTFTTDYTDIETKRSRLSETSLSQLSESNAIVKRYSGLDYQVTTLEEDEFTKESNFYEDERNFYSGTFTKPRSFVKPICDLFIALFSLNKSNSGWLRGRAIIVVLQQLLGSTIENYIKDMIGRVQSEEKVYELLVAVKEMLWINGTFFASNRPTGSPQRTESMILRSRKEASVLLDHLMMETCGRVVGLRGAKNTSVMLHAMLQNEYLNASLVLEILDIVFDELFQLPNQAVI
ncbi:Mdm1p Ecym_2702 [Eremothecium cymbalariae DBVPG|uniref:PXA domain-containing protein n=1 Tax=Eremothecium cymbalariae (strain CBS 270.75 / DBVPG 7215 / KCTC 17166 / NRRL Y-17582) TaxID=931890 RepID=G8JPE2_ERECY|nr:Hypothetical protein Ecym_2702 [Eremothecium cymbalariae DBVPG\